MLADHPAMYSLDFRNDGNLKRLESAREGQAFGVSVRHLHDDSIPPVQATAMLDQEGMLHIVTRGLDSEHIHSWDYAFLLKTIQARRIAPLGVFAWLERARTARNLIETAD